MPDGWVAGRNDLLRRHQGPRAVTAGWDEMGELHETTQDSVRESATID